MLGQSFMDSATLMTNDFANFRQAHQDSSPDLSPALAVKDFLDKYLPDKYGLDSGYAVTLTSPQLQDFALVIYDKNHHSYFGQYKKQNLFPMDSLYGIVEILEDLTEEALHESIENIRRFKSLDHGQSIQQKAGIVFAYRTDLSLKEITDLVDRLTYFYVSSQRPNAIFILNLGLVMPVKDIKSSEPSLFVGDHSVYAYFESKEHSLSIFYTYLVSLLNHIPLLPLNLYRYGQQMGFFGQESSIRLVIPPKEEAIKHYRKEDIAGDWALAQAGDWGQGVLPKNIDKYFQKAFTADELLEYLIENHQSYSLDLHFFRGDFLNMVYNSYDLHKLDCYRDESNVIRSHNQREFNHLAHEIYNIYLRIDASKL